MYDLKKNFLKNRQGNNNHNLENHDDHLCGVRKAESGMGEEHMGRAKFW